MAGGLVGTGQYGWWSGRGWSLWIVGVGHYRW